jgi:protein-L-isoaspartate O-methyltransferase
MKPYAYLGRELELFEKAIHWKAYWGSLIGRHISGAVLEVGAGIGANTAVLAATQHTRWVCLEPDRSLASRIVLPTGGRHSVFVGTTADLESRERFDTVLYLDVLEHIEEDGAELARVAAQMNPGGSLIVLAPAHDVLYTPFDREIGHFRRYTKSTLRAVAPSGFREDTMAYLDSAGLLASVGNRLLRRSMPTEAQILFWDRFLVPCSRVLDRLLMGTAGKSILAVWRCCDSTV